MPTTDDDYILPASREESDRLEAQAILYGGTAFLDPLLADDPRAVLDLGCGTGFFARHAAATLPDSRVVGLDMDASRLAYARKRADLPNLEFVEGELDPDRGRTG